jgi:hypothetical protein
MSMVTKEAVTIAKSWISEQLSTEGVQDIGLEEVKFESGYWYITIGISRPWDRNNLAAITRGGEFTRSYKVIVISDESKEVVEMRNREAA